MAHAHGASAPGANLQPHPLYNVWVPFPQERQGYWELFVAASAGGNVGGVPAVSGAQGAAFLVRSGLPGAVLKQVWDLSDVYRRGYLTFGDFGIAMRFVSLAQAGHLPLSAALFQHAAQAQLPMPRFAAPAATQAPAARVPAKAAVHMPSAALAPAAADADDEFGEFTAAPAPAPAPAPALAASLDDAFASMGPSAPTRELPPLNPRQLMDGSSGGHAPGPVPGVPAPAGVAFGDFDGGTPAPTQAPPTADDAFGEFSGGDSAAQDEFGDFGGAGTAGSPATHAAAAVDDAFGAFSAATAPKPSPPAAVATPAPPVSARSAPLPTAGAGGIASVPPASQAPPPPSYISVVGTAPPPSYNSVVTAAAAPLPPALPTGGSGTQPDAGGAAVAATAPTTPTPVPSPDADLMSSMLASSVSMFAAHPLKEAPVALDKLHAAATPDGGAAAGAAPAVAVWRAHTDADEEDPFAELAAPQPVPAAGPAPSSSPTDWDEPNDEDWGGFSGGEGEQGAATAAGGGPQAQAVGATQVAPSASASDDDEWGGFAAAPAATPTAVQGRDAQAGATVAEPTPAAAGDNADAGGASSSPTAVAVGEDDPFAALAAPAPDAPVPTLDAAATEAAATTATPSVGGDEWGDFETGDVGATTPAPAPSMTAPPGDVTTPAAASGAVEPDEWGGFEEAGAAAGADANPAAAEWGGFEEAPAAQPAAAEAGGDGDSGDAGAGAAPAPADAVVTAAPSTSVVAPAPAPAPAPASNVTEDDDPFAALPVTPVADAPLPSLAAAAPDSEVGAASTDAAAPEAGDDADEWGAFDTASAEAPAVAPVASPDEAGGNPGAAPAAADDEWGAFDTAMPQAPAPAASPLASADESRADAGTNAADAEAWGAFGVEPNGASAEPSPDTTPVVATPPTAAAPVVAPASTGEHDDAFAALGQPAAAPAPAAEAAATSEVKGGGSHDGVAQPTEDEWGGFAEGGVTTPAASDADAAAPVVAPASTGAQDDAFAALSQPAAAPAPAAEVAATSVVGGGSHDGVAQPTEDEWGGFAEGEVGTAASDADAAAGSAPAASPDEAPSAGAPAERVGAASEEAPPPATEAAPRSPTPPPPPLAPVEDPFAGLGGEVEPSVVLPSLRTLPAGGGAAGGGAAAGVPSSDESGSDGEGGGDASTVQGLVAMERFAEAQAMMREEQVSAAIASAKRRKAAAIEDDRLEEAIEARNEIRKLEGELAALRATATPAPTPGAGAGHARTQRRVPRMARMFSRLEQLPPSSGRATVAAVKEVLGLPSSAGKQDCVAALQALAARDMGAAVEAQARLHWLFSVCTGLQPHAAFEHHPVHWSAVLAATARELTKAAAALEGACGAAPSQATALASRLATHAKYQDHVYALLCMHDVARRVAGTAGAATALTPAGRDAWAQCQDGVKRLLQLLEGTAAQVPASAWKAAVNPVSDGVAPEVACVDAHTTAARDGPCYLCLQATRSPKQDAATPQPASPAGAPGGALADLVDDASAGEQGPAAWMAALAERRATAERAAWFAGRSYHVGCINLWLHRVSAQPVGEGLALA